MRIAVIDVGTNSTRLLICDTDKLGNVETVINKIITTRLGENMVKRNLTEAAVNRTIEAILEFKQIINQAQVNRVIVAATSAVRDAENQADFIKVVRVRTGLDLRVLSGPEEAAMSYLGVVYGLRGRCSSPTVIDVGGGSTEFVWTGESGLEFISLRVGAVRMTEGNNTQEEIDEIVGQTLDSIKAFGNKELIGVGGTVTSLAAIDQGLHQYDPSKIHGYFLKKNRVEEILEQLVNLTVEQRQLVTGLPPNRADIIVAGIRIVVAILNGLALDGLFVSETALLHGIVYHLLEGEKNIFFEN